MANQTRRTRRERNEQIPQRVENAAQNMYASSGMQRGYIPGGYAQTGTAQQQNGWGQAAQQPAHRCPISRDMITSRLMASSPR